MNINNYDTLIFDFDGTLLDSEPYHKLAHSKILSLILNKKIELSNKDFERYIGKKDTEIFEMYKKDFHIEFDKEYMINKKVETARDLLLDDNVKIFDYFFDLAKHKGNKQFYIVSNQHENILFPVLKAKGIDCYFDKIFCLPKINVKKDYFYKNIKEFISNVENAVVFEDDIKVLQFLTSLGYSTIGIKNQMNKENIADNCDFVINTIKTNKSTKINQIEFTENEKTL